jgi:hypothetical protein
MQTHNQEPQFEIIPQPIADVDEFDLDLRLGSVPIIEPPGPVIHASGSCSCTCGNKTACTCYSPCSCQTCGTCTCSAEPCDLENTCAYTCTCNCGGDGDDGW